MKVTIDVKPRESFSVQLEIDGKVYRTVSTATSYGATTKMETPSDGPSWEDTDLCEEIVDCMENIESAAYDLMAHGDLCDI